MSKVSSATAASHVKKKLQSRKSVFQLFFMHKEE